MSQNLLSLLTVVAVSIVVALASHLAFKRVVAASVGAGVLTSLAVHVHWTLRQGFFEGWFFLSFFTVGALAIGIALVLGFALRALRPGLRNPA